MNRFTFDIFSTDAWIRLWYPYILDCAQTYRKFTRPSRLVRAVNIAHYIIMDSLNHFLHLKTSPFTRLRPFNHMLTHSANAGHWDGEPGSCLCMPTSLLWVRFAKWVSPRVVVPWKGPFEFKASQSVALSYMLYVRHGRWCDECDLSGSMKRSRTQHVKTHKGISRLLGFMSLTHFQLQLQNFFFAYIWSFYMDVEHV